MSSLTEGEIHQLNHYSRERYIDDTLYRAFSDYSDGKITKEAYTKIVNQWAPLLQKYREFNAHNMKYVPVYWDRWKDASEVMDAQQIEEWRKEELEMWR